MLHTEFPPYLLDLYGFSLVLKDRLAGDDKEPGNLGKRRDDILGDAVAQVFACLVPAQVNKGEDGQGWCVR
jgi:hypothetical protein